MNFESLQQASEVYRPALLLDGVISARVRLLCGWIFSLVTIASFLATGTALILVAPLVDIALGFLCFSLAGLIFFESLEAFYNSFYFKDVRKVLPDSRLGRPQVTFVIADLVFHADPNNFSHDIFSAPLTGFLMSRLGILPDEYSQFLSGHTARIDTTRFSIPESESIIDLPELMKALFALDSTLSKFLFEHSIQENDLVAGAQWISRHTLISKRQARFWGRDALGRVPGIGKAWSYGIAYTLEKYSKRISESHVFLNSGTGQFYGKDELEELEAILVRTEGGNALLVGDDVSSKTDLVAHLGSLIESGKALPALEHKHIYVLDHEALISQNDTKAEFEPECIKLLEEAAHAGNIILVITDLPAFIKSAESIGADVVAILDSYLAQATLQIIALSSLSHFHETLERHADIMQRYEKILMKTITSDSTITLLEDEVVVLESKSPIFFTYPALVAIVESADRYFPDGIMPDKAFDLLRELVPKLLSQKKTFVQKSDVLALVETKTGIPLGAVKGEEKQKLLNLEKILHERIVGQDEAVTAIAQALRRARSGITSPNRPLGSFLFLGPTGVGKTETTKALAQAFFDDEKNILRLDMSEYTGADAVQKLIGSFDHGQAGVLSSMVREHPYGVLLLDEFEKTTKDVMNLFLQIIDEGVFSDMNGKKINARTLIIIATSNAGSDTIWQTIQDGKNLAAEKDHIVDTIVKSGTFKPELLNRFDGVILFHPLASEHVEKVARLMLTRLQTRLKERGIDLAITDELVRYLMTQGLDPKFGARPMNRAIQDHIEELIAKKMINGDIKPGSTVTLTESDLSVK